MIFKTVERELDTTRRAEMPQHQSTAPPSAGKSGSLNFKPVAVASQAGATSTITAKATGARPPRDIDPVYMSRHSVPAAMGGLVATRAMAQSLHSAGTRRAALSA